MSRLLGFLRRNIVLVICLPSIALIHYSWYHLQFNEDFVEESARRPNPFESYKQLSWFKGSGVKERLASLFSRIPLHCSRHGPRKTHYEVLGLKQDANTADIRAAFVKLSKEIHPDKNPDDPENHSKFVFLNEAYTILSKPLSRKEYDMSLAHWLHIQQSMARSGFSSHTAGNEPTPGSGPRQESYEGGSQQRVFWDETIWYMRDRSKDAGAFYDQDSYYGIKGIRRQSNSTIVAICLVIIACGFVSFFAALKYTRVRQRERLETIDRKRLRLLIETRERARHNGTAKQLEILNARYSAGRMGPPILSEEEP